MTSNRVQRAVIVLQEDSDEHPTQWAIDEVFSHCAYIRGPFDTPGAAEAEMRRLDEIDAGARKATQP